jgi:hypothetical protein
MLPRRHPIEGASFSHAAAYKQTSGRTGVRKQSLELVNTGTNRTLLEVNTVAQTAVAEAPHADRISVESVAVQ